MAQLSAAMRQYLLITANYWAFTLTDGALRMLVVLYFHQLGYRPLDIALLFIFYEFFGVVTNLIGGWLGARIGLNRTMNLGLFLQIMALTMLTLPTNLLTIAWVMIAQALSGIAKDLNKMSAKSAVKLFIPDDSQGRLFKWVAILTGSKNTLKGVGFFLGGALLTLWGFRTAVFSMLLALLFIWLFSLFSLKKDLGKSKSKPKFTEVFSNSRAINILSAARMFLFGARDVWFVIGLPVFLSSQFSWSHIEVGSFIACWIIGYGIVQSLTPQFIQQENVKVDAKQAPFWALILAIIPALIALSLTLAWHTEIILIIGLFVFGFMFAINSALHSYLIVSYARQDGVSLDIGYYYMANAMGRLIGTLLSGWIYQVSGLTACLWVSTGFIVFTSLISVGLPKNGQICVK